MRAGRGLQPLDLGPYHVRSSKPVPRPRRTGFPGRPKEGEFVDRQEIQEEDRTAGRAETAAARIDIGAWLRSLSRPQRIIAHVRASGETTGTAARTFRISSAGISQLRVWFKENWERLHGEQRSGQHARSGPVMTVR